MARKLIALVLFSILIGISLYLYSCRNRNLRGWWKYTSDGKTYLVIEDDPDGGSANNPCTLNGHLWPYPEGVKGEIEPGIHELRCPMNVRFEVPAGVEYHFDYWGP